VPLQARPGTREPDHWGKIPALELVDIGERSEAGATRGLRAWWPENFPEE
jgi:hypothetical protein